MKFEHGLLLDHDPGHPCIRHGEQEEQANDRTGTETHVHPMKLDAEGEDKENAGREDVDGPFETVPMNFHRRPTLQKSGHRLPSSKSQSQTAVGFQPRCWSWSRRQRGRTSTREQGW